MFGRWSRKRSAPVGIGAAKCDRSGVVRCQASDARIYPLSQATKADMDEIFVHYNGLREGSRISV